MLMVLVSLYATYDIAVSLSSIIELLVGIALFYTVVLFTNTTKRWWFALLLLGALEFAVSLAGLLSIRWSKKFLAIAALTSIFPPRLLGIPGIDEGIHPNIIAGTLLWVLPLVLLLTRFVILQGWLLPALSITGNPHSQDSQKNLKNSANSASLRLILSSIFRKEFLGAIAILIVALVTLGVFILTQSRGGYIAFAVTAVCLFVLLLPKRRYQLIAVGLLVILIIVGAVIAYSNRDALDGLLKNGDAADPALSLDTLEGRVEIWSRALYGIEDFPFTGMGMNTFRKIVHVLYPLFLTSPDRDIGHAHNEFLQAALDLGIPGLIAFISLYLISFWMLTQIWRAGVGDDPELTRTLALGLGGGLLAHLLFGLTDAVIFAAKPAILFWFLLGLIAALYRNSTEKKSLIH